MYKLVLPSRVDSLQDQTTPDKCLGEATHNKNHPSIKNGGLGHIFETTKGYVYSH